MPAIVVTALIVLNSGKSTLTCKVIFVVRLFSGLSCASDVGGGSAPNLRFLTLLQDQFQMRLRLCRCWPRPTL